MMAPQQVPELPERFTFDDIVGHPFPGFVFDRLLEAATDTSSSIPKIERHKILAIQALCQKRPSILRENLAQAWNGIDPLKVLVCVFQAAFRVAPAREVVDMVPAALAMVEGACPNKVRVERIRAALTKAPVGVATASATNHDAVPRQVILLNPHSKPDGKSRDAHPNVEIIVSRGSKTPLTKNSPKSASDDTPPIAVTADSALDYGMISSMVSRWNRTASGRSDFPIYQTSNCILTAYKPTAMMEYGPLLVALHPCLENFHHARWCGYTLAPREIIQELERATVFPRIGVDNHYHRLIDNVASILALPDWARSNDFLVADDLSKYSKLLSLFGMDSRRIHSYRNGLPLRIKTAYLVPILRDSTEKISRARVHIAERTSTPPRTLKLYLSRARSHGRRLSNEAAVESIVSSHGYRIVYLESMSVLEQFNLFRQARAVIGPHGAGLANTIFCQDGLHMLEIMPEHYMVPFYFRLARTCGFSYSLHVGAAASSEEGRMDWSIDEAAFSRALDGFESRLPAP